MFLYNTHCEQVVSRLINSQPSRCPNSISEEIRNQLRRYEYCEVPANLTTLDQVITLYKDSIIQTIDLLILAEIDVRQLLMNASLCQQCPYGATVYDACSDSM